MSSGKTFFFIPKREGKAIHTVYAHFVAQAVNTIKGGGWADAVSRCLGCLRDMARNMVPSPLVTLINNTHTHTHPHIHEKKTPVCGDTYYYRCV